MVTKNKYETLAAKIAETFYDWFGLNVSESSVLEALVADSVDNGERMMSDEEVEYFVEGTNGEEFMRETYPNTFNVLYNEF